MKTREIDISRNFLKIPAWTVKAPAGYQGCVRYEKPRRAWVAAYRSVGSTAPWIDCEPTVGDRRTTSEEVLVRSEAVILLAVTSMEKGA